MLVCARERMSVCATEHMSVCATEHISVCAAEHMSVCAAEHMSVCISAIDFVKDDTGRIWLLLQQTLVSHIDTIERQRTRWV